MDYSDIQRFTTINNPDECYWLPWPFTPGIYEHQKRIKARLSGSLGRHYQIKRKKPCRIKAWKRQNRLCLLHASLVPDYRPKSIYLAGKLSSDIRRLSKTTHAFAGLFGSLIML